MRLDPNDPQAIYNAALSRLALGELDAAEALFGRVIALNPSDFDAWLNRSTLRRQTTGANHVAALRALLERLPDGHEGSVPLHHALAKELEDLGEYDASFAHLQAGASARRQRLSYEVADDEQAMQGIATRFADPMNDEPGHDSERAILVLGLPRSGTTLVDRIVSSHSQVASLGEVHALPFALMHTVGPHRDRADLIERSAHCDFELLGRRYVGALSGYGESAPRLLDKTPFNLLYLGVLRRALPKAKVIHLRRDPVDACYAMYKTLFRSGYPFSYSLQDVGRFTIAYHRLMAHWRRVLPDWFLDVDYESLVSDTEGEVRRILDFLGLPFEPACLSPHKQSAPVATASAVQVRAPIHRESVQRWRCYERQLAPLAGKLREAGLPVT
jgi:tetratricopeptide (TPR) repeat protein